MIYLALEGAGYDLVIRQQVALAAWLLIAVGFAAGVLPRGRLPREILFPAIALASLGLWMILSFNWTGSDERTTAELARLLGYAGLMGLAVTTLNRHTFSAAAQGVAVAVVVVVAIALLSRLFPAAFPAADDIPRLFGTDRLTYPLDYWNAVGAWGAMAVTAALIWSAHAKLPATRIASLAIVPLAGACVYLTYSRGAAVAAGVAAIAALVLSRNRWTLLAHAIAAAAGTGLVIVIIRESPEIANGTGGEGGGAVAQALLVAAVLCAAAALVTRTIGTDRWRLTSATAAWAMPGLVLVLVLGTAVLSAGPLSRAWEEFRSEETVTAGPDPAARLTSAGGNRNDLWSSALDAFETEPLKGIGPGTYEFWWSADGRDPEFVRDAHSLYLEQLAELGLPGLLLLICFLLGCVSVAMIPRRRLRSDVDHAASGALVAMFCVFLVTAGFDWMWEETAVALVGLGGIAIAAAAGSDRLRRSQRRGRIGVPGVRTTIVLAALVGAAVQVPGLVSIERLRASQAAASDGDLATSETLAEEAIDAQPWAATPHAQLSLVNEATGELRAARAEIGRAISREPMNWRWPIVLARIQLDMGDREGARRTFAAGRKLQPRSPFYSPFSPLGQRLFTDAELRRIAATGEIRP